MGSEEAGGGRRSASPCGNTWTRRFDVLLLRFIERRARHRVTARRRASENEHIVPNVWRARLHLGSKLCPRHNDRILVEKTNRGGGGTQTGRTLPLDGRVLVLQAVHDGSPVALHCIVVRPDDLLKRRHGDVPAHAHGRGVMFSCRVMVMGGE